jgi:hypothetical protein
MNRSQLRKSLVGGALVLAIAGAALGAAMPSSEPTTASPTAPALVAPLHLAELASKAPPDVVIILLDEATPPIPGAMPVSAFGADDAAFLQAAPKFRRIVLAGQDTVRADRLARQLATTGRRVDVVDGGLTAWTHAMKQDPSPPEATAHPDVWAAYQNHVALRRYIVDEAAAPPPVVNAPAPVMVGAPPPRKREGC